MILILGAVALASGPRVQGFATRPPQQLMLIKSAVPPPKNLMTVRHDKDAGGGYKEGSPLYSKQQAMKVGEAVEPAPQNSTLATPFGTPGGGWWSSYLVWGLIFILVVGALAICAYCALYRSRPSRGDGGAQPYPQPHQAPPKSQPQMGTPPATVQTLPPGHAPSRHQVPPQAAERLPAYPADSSTPPMGGAPPATVVTLPPDAMRQTLPPDPILSRQASLSRPGSANTLPPGGHYTPPTNPRPSPPMRPRPDALQSFNSPMSAQQAQQPQFAVMPRVERADSPDALIGSGGGGEQARPWRSLAEPRQQPPPMGSVPPRGWHSVDMRRQTSGPEYPGDMMSSPARAVD